MRMQNTRFTFNYFKTGDETHFNYNVKATSHFEQTHVTTSICALYFALRYILCFACVCNCFLCATYIYIHIRVTLLNSLQTIKLLHSGWTT